MIDEVIVFCGLRQVSLSLQKGVVKQCSAGPLLRRFEELNGMLKERELSKFVEEGIVGTYLQPCEFLTYQFVAPANQTLEKLSYGVETCLFSCDLQ